MNKLWKLGFASSLQMLFEVGVFALSTNIAAHLTTQALAAHQIVLNIATFTFMVPMGLGSATAVLVGQSMGREDFDEARRVGWKGLAIGIGYMTLASLAILVFADPLLGFFTIDPTVAGLGKQIILIAALFQISDGIQTVGTGALRGLANTRTPMIANLVGHWLIGLPVGLVLAFGFHWGLQGLWTGLSVGLTVVAVWLMACWIRHWSRRPGLSHATP
jgi:MATE family multidrug resistance protein